MTKVTLGFVLTLFIAMTAIGAGVDEAPLVGPVTPHNPTDDPWDMVFYFDAGTTADDTHLLGVGFGAGLFCVTGGNSGLDPNYIYMFNPDGTLNFSFEQLATSTGWGYRDVAWDGSYFYGSVTTQVVAWDATGTYNPAMYINGPSNPNRALAWDPVTDSFWTASFSGPIYNFDRSGAVIWTGASGLSGVYGMAWHDMTGMLWIHDQTIGTGLTLLEYDPVAHALTGFQIDLPEPAGWSSGIAGGASWTDEYDPALPGGAFAILAQGSPTDYVSVFEAPEGSTTPVELSAFNANVVEDGVMLTWSTASELNCYQWTVQRNGVDVATLPGNGTTVEPQNYSYFDEVGAGDYTYRLKETDLSGAVTYSNEISVTVGAAFVTEYSLSGNYPNPFNPTTNIAFALPEAGTVNLSVYNVNGSQVATLIDGHRDAGAYEVTFDATGLTSGIYFYKLTVGDFSSMHKMVLMK